MDSSFDTMPATADCKDTLFHVEQVMWKLLCNVSKQMLPPANVTYAFVC